MRYKGTAMMSQSFSLPFLNLACNCLKFRRNKIPEIALFAKNKKT
jgi:hypothetical protein